MSETSSSPDAFSGVDTWIFDLDNTLYPPHSNLFAQVDKKMGTFISRLLDVDLMEAKRVQKTFYKTYGTTLRGLMTEHGVDPHEFLAYVHEIDHSPIEPDPALGAALSLLPGRKFVLTNGSRAHADAIVRRLGIEVPHTLGMRTVLVVAAPDTPQETLAYRQRWEVEIGTAAHIDHVTDDLADFLVSVAETTTGRD